MRKIIDRKVYDTETAERVAEKTWLTWHPNSDQKSDRCPHTRAVYRTKKGALFGYIYDLIGYGRDRSGSCGAFTREEESIFVIASAEEAAAWMESMDFNAEAIIAAFPDVIEEA